MSKPTKSEELAELMFRERNDKQIRYARERYASYAFFQGMRMTSDYPVLRIIR